MRKYLPLFLFLVVYTTLSFTIFPTTISSVLRVVRPLQVATVETSHTATLVSALPTATPTVSAFETAIPTALASSSATSASGLGTLISASPSLVPATLVIPKLNISASVEQVGQTKTGAMDVPKNAANVAWYVYGAKPGEVGNAVINGHYDTPSGRGAVFYHLKDLVKGDDVDIISDDGTQKSFVVTEKAEVPIATFPSDYIFFTKPGTNLNLITCDGIWSPTQHNYSTRMVIYTQLKV